MNNERQEINIFIDDSGVFVDSEAERFFVYAGYVLVGPGQRFEAHNRYKKLSNDIRTALEHNGELKAAHLNRYPDGKKYKGSLVRVMKKYDSFACVVDIPNIREVTKIDKLSRYRYKDYCLKVGLKRKLNQMILNGIINPSSPTNLNIFIDEQHTATNGFYELESSIRAEYVHGVGSKMFFTYHAPIFSTKDVNISVKYCDSSKNYLVQAADLLANRIHSSYHIVQPNLRDINKMQIVKFP